LAPIFSTKGQKGAQISLQKLNCSNALQGSEVCPTHMHLGTATLTAFAQGGPMGKVVWAYLWYYLNTQSLPEPECM